TRGPQLCRIGHATEGASAANLLAEGLRRDVEAERLTADHRVVEVDLDLGAEAVGIRPQLAGGGAGNNLNGFEDFDVAARRRKLDNPRPIDGSDERRSAAVHDRRFR